MSCSAANHFSIYRPASLQSEGELDPAVFMLEDELDTESYMPEQITKLYLLRAAAVNIALKSEQIDKLVDKAPESIDKPLILGVKSFHIAQPAKGTKLARISLQFSHEDQYYREASTLQKGIGVTSSNPWPPTVSFGYVQQDKINLDVLFRAAELLPDTVTFDPAVHA